jgi:AraC-like DNA-binding protein
MHYREIRPGAVVAQFVKCYWVLEDEAPSLQPQTIVPDGRAELLINLHEPFLEERDGKWERQPNSFLVGQLTGPFTIRPSGPVRAIGVRFRPEGAYRLVQLPMFELTDATVAVDDISQRLSRKIDRLRGQRSVAEQIRSLEKFLSAAANQTDEDRLVSVAVSELERANGDIAVSTLAHSLGMSFRQLERRFRNAVGIAPKLFSRMQRFQQIFRNAEANANWVDAAVSCGYYDQAHLIRDFREFSGTTPTALLAEQFDLSRRFV